MFHTLRGLRSRRVGIAVAWLSLLLSGSVTAASPDGVWDDVAERAIASSPASRQIVPQRYRTVRLDQARFDRLLRGVPQERAIAAGDSDATLTLPLVDGSYATFRIAEAPVMAPELAKKFPELRTWVGQGVDDPTATLRFDVTPKGFHAQILSATGTHYVDPFQAGDVENYIAYRKQDHQHGETIRCGVTGEDISKEDTAEHLRHVGAKVSSGGTLRTYRLAMAATGEYTDFHGGTVADALAGIVSTVNRVNGIYEREVSVRFQLIANNDELIFTDAGSDPFVNTADDIDTIVGTLNDLVTFNGYDVGHLVGTGGGGVAGLGVICSADKGAGLTGSDSPVGDAYDIDYVAHEMGHQFGGSHTFNGSGLNCAGGNRSGSSAYEPGSGITIQAYAGICAGDNLQPNSEDYFHRRSLNQILTHTTTGTGGSCGTTNATGNAIPTVTPAGTAFAIPESTPFELEATGADANSDALTYVWEQFDLGAANAVGMLNPEVAGPLFRSFAPGSASSRVFPSLKYILNNANVPPALGPPPGTAANFFTGEVLPAVIDTGMSPPPSRLINFRVTVRDNRAAGGGTNEANVAVTVVNGTGPVAITAPNTALTWAAGSSQTVTWNVAGSNTGTVNTANVRITLSLDGGNTWPVELAASEANDGSATVTVPAGTPGTTNARVRVKAVGNIWFDVSNSNFTITGSNDAPTISGTGTVTTSQGGPTASAIVRTVNDLQDGPAALTVAVAELPEGLSATATNLGGQVSLAATAACGLATPTSGTKIYPVRLDVTDSALVTSSSFVDVLVSANLAPTIGVYANTAVARGTTTPIAPASAVVDPNGNLGAVTVSPTTLPGGGTIAVAANGTVSVTTTAGTTFGSYPVQVRADDGCGAAEIKEFTVTVASTEAVLDLASSQVLTGNGLIEPNECNQLALTLANSGTVAATAVSATLSTTTPNVTITQASASFADIPAGQSRTTVTPFEVSSNGALVCLSSIDFTVTVNFSGGSSPLVDTFSLTAGQPAASNYVFTASSGATIPAGGVLLAGSAADNAILTLPVPAGFNSMVYSTAITGGTNLRVSTNGNLQLAPSGGTPEYANGGLPSTGIVSGDFATTFPVSTPTLMPWWDDVLPTTAGGGIYTQLVGIAPNRQWIIEWRGRIVSDGGSATNTIFAIVLREGSNLFDYVYTQAGAGPSLNGATATIGVQAANSGPTFTQFSRNAASITAGTRLSATLPPQICSAGGGSCGATPAIVVTQSAGATGASEGAGGDTITVALATAPSADVAVTLTPSTGVAVDLPTLDFTAATWNIARTVNVTAVDDRIVEGAHAGSISIAASGGDYTGISAAPIAVAVNDDDSAIYRFTTATSSVDEAAGTVNLGVELVFATSGSGVPALQSAITIPITMHPSSSATGGGVDYTLLTGNVVIPTSGTAQNVAIALVDGDVADPDETASPSLGAETGGSAGQQAVVISSAPSTHVLTITDADVAGVVVGETGGNTAVTEGGAGDSYTLVLTSEPTSAVTITIAPDAELTANPTTRIFTPGNWDQAQSVAVGAFDDTDIEGAHTGTLTHTAAGGDYGVVAVAQLAVDVADDDLVADLAVDVVRSAGAVLAGQPVTFEVTVNNLSDLIDVASADFGFVVAPVLENVEWTCAADLGASCPASGSGVPAHSIGLPRDTGVQYTITGDVPAAAATGTVHTATATIAPDAPNSDDNSANDSDAATATVDGNGIFASGFEGNP